jgi:hypothetical protein
MEGDTKEMARAISELNGAGIEFCRPSRYQLKIGNLNYYPDRKTIYVDGADQAENDRGIEALIARLGDRRVGRVRVTSKLRVCD